MVKPLAKVSIEQALPAMLRQHFGLFLRFACRELVKAEPFTAEWHLEAIEHQLLRQIDGDITKLIVTLPPRHLKSVMISVAFVAWMLGR